MARKKRLSDRVTIIRKRFQRESERFAKQADQASKEGKPRLAARLAAASSVAKEEAETWKLKTLRKTYKGADLLKKIMRGEKESQKALASAGAAARRERIAKAILKLRGHAFYAGTVDLWRGAKYGERDQLILDALGVDTLWEALELIERGAKIDLLESEAVYEKYDKDQSADIAEYISTLNI